MAVSLLWGFVASARRYPVLVTVVIVAGVAAAVATSLTLQRRYEAAASLVLTRTALGLELSSLIARRTKIVSRRVDPPRNADVEVLARPGDPVVRVFVVADAPTAARRLANDYAAELVALDRGLPRRSVENSEFVNATTATVIEEPEPVEHGVAALAVSSLFALALARLLDVARRQQARRATPSPS